MSEESSEQLLHVAIDDQKEAFDRFISSVHFTDQGDKPVAWKVPEGSGYTNVPDLVVLAPAWARVAGNHVSPPPLLVVEVASPSTRAVDRGRKLSDYRTGGAGCYLLAGVPALTRGDVSFELHDFEAGAITTTDGSVDLVLGGRAVRFDLTSFRGRILGQ